MKSLCQCGFLMIEALIAIFIFCLGILGLVAMGGAAIGAQSDAQYRTEAARWADNLASQMALTVDRGSPPDPRVLTVSVATFAHQPGGANCVFTGAVSSNTVVTNWINDLSAASSAAALPGATSARQQIKVDASANGFNRVEITLCWKAPADTAVRSHTLVTYIN